MKNVVAAYPYLNSMPEATLRRFGLMSLPEEIPKQPSIDYIVPILVVTLMRIYDEQEQTDHEKYTLEKNLRRS